MRDRASHYAAADRLLEDVKDQTCMWGSGARERMLYAAIAHAMLATTSDAVYAKVEIAARHE